VHGDVERAVDLEIQHHVDELVDRLIATGWAESAARREAARRFGDVYVHRQAMLRETQAMKRRMRVRDLASSLRTDTRHALRGLRRSRTFAATVILTVGLGIGAAAAVFTVIDALLLRPLPYHEPERLVTLESTTLDGSWRPFLPEQVGRWSELETPLSPLALFQQGSYVRTDGAEPEMLSALIVSHGLDETLGLRAHLGRTFTSDDAAPGVGRVMLGYGYWQRLGSDPGVVGSTIELEGIPYDVVGVLPRDFKFPVAGRASKIWLAMGADLSAAGQPLSRIGVVARLDDGVTREAAQARLGVQSETLARDNPSGRGWRVVLERVDGWRGNQDLVRGVWMLGGAVALMLLIALANGVNLQLFRATDRAREIEVRRALGASRTRLLRLILTEGVLLGLGSGLAATLLALLCVAGLNVLQPDDLAFASVYSIRIEQRVLTFTFLVSVCAGMILGLIPGIRAVRTEATRFHLLKERGASGRNRRLNHILAGAEIALAMMLLIGAGLLANSLVRLAHVDPGFDAEHIAMLSLSLPEKRYPTPQSRGAFFARLEQVIESLPGVTAVTVSNSVPPNTGFSFGVSLQTDGHEPLDIAGTDQLLPRADVLPDYMSTLGGDILAGRDLIEADAESDNILVNDRLARALWPDGAVNRRLRIDEGGRWYTVVGVFRHMTMLGLDDRNAQFSMIQPRNADSAGPFMALAIRTTGDPTAVLLPVRLAVRDLDAQLPIYELQTARAALSDTIDKPRFLASVVMALSLTALLLAVIGIYGVLSTAVLQRRREMGIRVALGAEPRRVQALFVQQGLLVTLLGMAAGITGGVVLTGLIRNLLFGITSTDPLTLSCAAAVIFMCAGLACYFPARRATRVDPVEVLRAE
jgi:predicted permease